MKRPAKFFFCAKASPKREAWIRRCFFESVFESTGLSSGESVLCITNGQMFAAFTAAAGKSGQIVNLASTLGLMAAPKRAAYTASKHGVVGLTKQMALELGEKGIRVNAVAPGVVRTPLTERYFQDPDYAQVIRDIHAVGRWAEPREIAQAILFLADEANSFITGTILTVDGGWTAGKKM